MKSQRLTRLVVAMAWLVSLGICFVLGALLGIPLGRSGGSVISNHLDGGTAPVDAELNALFVRYTGSALLPQSDPGGLPDAWKLAWKNLLRVEDPNERAYVAGRFAGVLSLSQIADAAVYISGLPRASPQEEALSAVCRRWGELDGRSALAFAADTVDIGHEVLLQAALAGWAARDPKAAWQWVLDRPVGRGTESARYAAILRSLASKDPDYALGLAASLPFAALREDALMAFARQQLEQAPPQRVINYWQELPPSPQRDTLYKFTAERWARYDPLAASTWVTTEVAQPLRNSLLVSVAQSWVQTNPRQAMKWAFTVDASEQADVVTATSLAWLEQEGPSPIAKWLNTEKRTAAHEPIINALALTLADTNPPAALTWARALHNSDNRDYAVTAVYKKWLQAQPDAALMALYADSGAPAELRAQVGIATQPVYASPPSTLPAEENSGDVIGEVALPTLPDGE
ncbi:MAG: hypothetical protein SFY80_14305 [Verrucomicrobiota bacterium]|nr:hypothetical protein [Verrucomicrobiota bacterium]